MSEQNQQHRLSLGQRFREVRELAGYTRGRIQEAADAIGISRAALDQFERDATYPKLETLHRMAQVYMCEMGDLLPRTETGYGREFEPLAAALMGIPAEARESIIRNFAQTVKYIANSAVAGHRVGQTPIRDATPIINIDNRGSVGAMSPIEAALLSHPQFAGSTQEKENGRREHSNKAKTARGTGGDKGGKR